MYEQWMQQLRQECMERGRKDAYAFDPTRTMTSESLRWRARCVARNRLRIMGMKYQERPVVHELCCNGYIEGWIEAEREMNTVPCVRTRQHVWTLGYRNEDTPSLLNDLFDSADPEASCRLLIDIRYRPAAPFRPQWSRKRLREKYHHQYRYLYALGNRRHHSNGLVELVHEDVGLLCLERWLAAGWDLVLLCACADEDGCHRTLVREQLRFRAHLHAQHHIVFPSLQEERR